MLRTGQKAPDFALPGVEDGTPAVYELFRPIEEGDRVVLWFVPATFLPTVTPELQAITEAGWHEQPGLQVWVLSMDSIYAAAAYADQYGFRMPFLGDAGGAAGQYGIEYDEWEGHYGVPKRAVFLIDSDWTVSFAWSTDDAFAVSQPSPVKRIEEEIHDRFPDVSPAPTVEYDH